MRLFVGTVLDERSQESCERFVKDLVGHHRGVLRGVPARSFHMTYAFTAHAPDDAVPTIEHAMSGVVRTHHAFTVTLEMPEVIGPAQKPRLVAASVGEGREALGRLARDVAAAVARACPEANVEPTKSLHVTLARFGRSARRPDARNVGEWLKTRGRARFGILIGGVQLIRSDLGGPSPVYTILRDVPIEG